MHRRLLLASLLATPALAQGQPTRILIGYPPGSPPDLIARLYAPGLAERLGVTVVVENRPGANTAIATEALLRAAPDGTTTMMMPQFVPALPAVQKVSGFDVGDLLPLAGTGQAPLVLLVPAGRGITDLAGFLAMARQQGDKLSFAHAGHAGVPNLAMALLAEATGITPQGVAFRNTTEALLNGSVACAFGFFNDAVPQVKAGRLVALAAVPCCRELGYPGVRIAAGFAVTVHRAVPAAMQQRWIEAVRAVRPNPEIAEKMAAAGFAPFTLEGPELQAFALAERDRHYALFKRLGVEPA